MTCFKVHKICNAQSLHYKQLCQTVVLSNEAGPSHKWGNTHTLFTIDMHTTLHEAREVRKHTASILASFVPTYWIQISQTKFCKQCAFYPLLWAYPVHCPGVTEFTVVLHVLIASITRVHLHTLTVLPDLKAQTSNRHIYHSIQEEQ